MNVRKGVPVKTYSAGAISTRTAAFLLRSIIESPLGNDLIPSYIANLVVAIESTINDAFIDFLHKRMGADYKRHCKTFLWLRFKEKVSLLVLLASDFKYELDGDFGDLKSILSLVDLRNRLLHVKQHWFSATVTETQDGASIEFENENDRDLLRFWVHGNNDFGS